MFYPKYQKCVIWQVFTIKELVLLISMDLSINRIGNKTHIHMCALGKILAGGSGPNHYRLFWFLMYPPYIQKLVLNEL